MRENSSGRGFRYGAQPEQRAWTALPGPGTWPAVVLLHGGFWRARYTAELMTPLIPSLLAAGFAAVNVEFRRVGQPGGGWPGTLTDVATAVDAVGVHPAIDGGRVAVLGHSAGGQLALWTAARHRLPPAAPGAGPSLRPVAAVSLAGVLDLEAAARYGLGAGAVAAFLGGSPRDVPERYTWSSPLALLPSGTATFVGHGTADDTVPVGQARDYAAAADRAGDPADLVVWPSADHFDVLAPAGPPWQEVLGWLADRLGLSSPEDPAGARRSPARRARPAGRGGGRTR